MNDIEKDEEALDCHGGALIASSYIIGLYAIIFLLLYLIKELSK